MIKQPILRRFSVTAVSFTAFASGCIAIFTPVVSRLPLRLSSLAYQFHPILVHRALSIFLGFALIYISYQLAQRRVAAWWITLVISAYLTITAGFFHSPILLPLVAAATIVELLLARSQFTARSEYQSIRQGVVLLVASLVLAVVYGIVGFSLLDERDFSREIGVREAAVRTLQEYTLSGNNDLTPRTRYARGFLDSIDFIGMVSLGFGLYSLFRPLTYTLRTLPQERHAMRRLLEAHGDYSEGNLKLWPADKSYFFLPRQQAGIAYRVNAGVALAVGAPVGEQRQRTHCITAFTGYCRNNSWDPVFVLIPERGLELFDDRWRQLKVGEDAIVPLGRFAKTVCRNKHFRNITNRFRKLGYTFTVEPPPHSGKLVRELAAVTAAWQESGKRQWGFIQGSFEPAYLAEGPLYVVRDAAERVLAFANGVTDYVDGQATVDMMRHLPDAPPNTMDYLLMNVLQAAHEAGHATFNLGLAPLTSSTKAETSPEVRIINAVGRLNPGFISVDGLRQFKNKFEPDWDSQYLVYQGLPTALPKIGIALARATQL